MAIKSSPTGQGYKLNGWPAAKVVFWGLLLVSLLFPHFITIIYLLSYDSNVVALHCIWKSGLQVTDICIFCPKGTEGKWWLMWREKLVLKYWRYLAKLLEQQRGIKSTLSFKDPHILSTWISAFQSGWVLWLLLSSSSLSLFNRHFGSGFTVLIAKTDASKILQKK